MNISRVKFSDLAEADLYVDCIYEGGNAGNMSSEVLSKLFPKCGNASGFRKVMREDNSNKLAYVILVTTMSELEWPDYLDVETGVFRYYGDNRKPGNDILNTKQGGNKLLEMTFNMLNSDKYDEIPPFFIFRKASNTGNNRNMQFLGLAAPGNPHISPDKDLVSFWRTINDKRFQNYESYFTILDTGSIPITKKWIRSLLYDNGNSMQFAPAAWKEFVNKGRKGIRPLVAPKNFVIPSKYQQLQSDIEGGKCLDIIRMYYKDNPYGFESCATDLIAKMDNHFIDFNLTRPWRDGGRDALGIYSISTGNNSSNYPLKFDCALEAKCYDVNNSVGVKQMSRLISRIRYRQFGIMVTTSYVNSQAYQEVVEDGHPILIVTASDIAQIIRQNNINSNNIYDWLEYVDGLYKINT